ALRVVMIETARVANDRRRRNQFGRAADDAVAVPDRVEEIAATLTPDQPEQITAFAALMVIDQAGPAACDPNAQRSLAAEAQLASRLEFAIRRAEQRNGDIGRAGHQLCAESRQVDASGERPTRGLGGRANTTAS